LGIVWWVRGLRRWDFAWTAPFFLIAGLLTAVNVWFQTHGTEVVARDVSFVERLLGAGGVIWFYLYKAVFPIDLAFVYRQWHIDAGNPLWWIPLLVAVCVTAVLWRYRGAWARPGLFAWGFFCMALVPVMGFTDVGFMQYSLVADHYQHIAIIAVIALAAALWSAWRGQAQKVRRWAATLTAVAAAGLLTLLALRQSAIYRDPIALYQATLGESPDCWMAQNNLGGTLARAGLRDEAEGHYLEALRLRSEYPEAHNNLGSLLSETGHLPDAIEHYVRAIRLKPGYADAYNNLGNALTGLGRTTEAIEQFELALRFKPTHADAHNNLSVVLAQTGQLAEAAEHLRQAVRIRPDYLNAHVNLALVCERLNQMPEAVAAAERALEIARAQGQAEQAANLEAWLKSHGQ